MFRVRPHLNVFYGSNWRNLCLILVPAPLRGWWAPREKIGFIAEYFASKKLSNYTRVFFSVRKTQELDRIFFSRCEKLSNYSWDFLAPSECRRFRVKEIVLFLVFFLFSCLSFEILFASRTSRGRPVNQSSARTLESNQKSMQIRFQDPSKLQVWGRLGEPGRHLELR